MMFGFLTAFEIIKMLQFLIFGIVSGKLDLVSTLGGQKLKFSVLFLNTAIRINA
jgi:hypothetical protein